MSNFFENIGIDQGIMILILIVLVLILMLMTLNLSLGLHRLKRKYMIFMKGKDAQSLERQFINKFREIDRLSTLTDVQMNDFKVLKSDFEKTLTKYGIVKYDAFDDVGGKLSFVLSMLDQNNTGFVLNAIHSRENCFLYIKEIVKGESYIMLSEEEVEALRRAVTYGSDAVN
ncbi:DUF4446 family protein [Ruminococcus gauvreauii]|uniref:DUF4446 family protein n=1 Tax=Ruminococcus gauvreauii TaxID=438033 RepID=A0ABY5VMF2_9FIRM|nr:DUF4446 family protein [Ruminococcus gauvreauii]UWP61148.1 DUF4446 family protein [Ruminococcus gauvreauii]